MCNEIEQYVNNVKFMLSSIDAEVPVKASYDTGYGMHLVDAYLGDEAHCVDVRAHSVLKIAPPKIDALEAWESAWNQARELVNEFVATRTEK